MQSRERRAVAALWTIPGVGPATLEALRAQVGELGQLLEVPVSAWAAPGLLRASALEALSSWRLEHLEARAAWLERTLQRTGQIMLVPSDPGWPPLLQGPRAPWVLFARGPVDVGPRRWVAIVGTRTPEAGAIERVRTLAAALASRGVGVVSGAAIGIDRAAHLGALDGGGPTWAFLGCGIDQMDAAQAVLQGPFAEGQGTFWSQFPPTVRADRSTFIRRNALIAGCAHLTLVARAPADSGALSTARAASELGRPVMVIPADPWNPAGRGSNTLLRSGAMACTGVEDILEALGFTSVVGRVTAPRRVAPTGDAAAVLAHLRSAPRTVDELSALARLDPGAVLSALTSLELDGHVLQHGGGLYELTDAHSFVDASGAAQLDT